MRRKNKKGIEKYLSLAKSTELSDREREVFIGINYEQKTFLDYCDQWKINDRGRIAQYLRIAYDKISKNPKFNEKTFESSLNSQYSIKNWLL